MRRLGGENEGSFSVVNLAAMRAINRPSLDSLSFSHSLQMDECKETSFYA